ncbi:unnamed protein product [Gongylonema pulchrum]|uniref:CTNNB1_binding domain-containing protein n=1 Tax=Gongylonema pulchrum TaxID=637853 RepID=A0A183EPY7_9BILA|nr:unnamed protein product [Gongylonema pulchrum]
MSGAALMEREVSQQKSLDMAELGVEENKTEMEKINEMDPTADISSDDENKENIPPDEENQGKILSSMIFIFARRNHELHPKSSTAVLAWRRDLIVL